MNFQLRLSDRDLRQLAAGVNRAMRLQATTAATALAEKAVRLLTQADQRLGHTQLANMWTYLVTPTGSGGAFARVYSTAETQVFYNKTSDSGLGRVRSTLYPIQGRRLLAILEGGARAHPIRPRRGDWLTIPSGPGGPLPRASSTHPSRFSFLRPEAPVDADFVRLVDHPGVSGNFNIDTVGKALLATVATEAAAAVSRVKIEMV